MEIKHYCIFISRVFKSFIYYQLYLSAKRMHESPSERKKSKSSLFSGFFYFSRYYELIPALQTNLVFRGKFWRGDIQIWHLAMSS